MRAVGRATFVTRFGIEMRYRVIAKVEGEVYTGGTASVDRDGLRFEFLCDKSGKISEVAVSIQISEELAGRFGSSTGRDEDGQLVFKVDDDPEIHKSLIQELQNLEANLAFATTNALRRIRWDTPRQEFVPENPQEENSTPVRSFGIEKLYPVRPTFISFDDLANLVTRAPKYDSLIIPKAFFHSGLNFLKGFQYIQAFYSFYFVLEDLYARGKTGTEAVLREFTKSKEFGQVAENTLQNVLKEPEHGDNLLHMFKEANCEVSARGLSEFLLETRGRLHHYYSKSSKTQGTPFNQDEYESVAILTMHMATLAIGYRSAAISNRTNDNN